MLLEHSPVAWQHATSGISEGGGLVSMQTLLWPQYPPHLLWFWSRHAVRLGAQRAHKTFMSQNDPRKVLRMGNDEL